MKVSSIRDRFIERSSLSVKTSSIYEKLCQNLDKQRRDELSAIDNQYLIKYNQFIGDFNGTPQMLYMGEDFDCTELYITLVVKEPLEWSNICDIDGNVEKLALVLSKLTFGEDYIFGERACNEWAFCSDLTFNSLNRWLAMRFCY